MEKNVRQRIQIKGIVQGVGFRPFVYTLATRAGLSGYVLNDAAGVTIEAEGNQSQLEAFTEGLRAEAPPLAMIEQMTVQTLPPAQNGDRRHDFVIASSQDQQARSVFIAPDVATCDDCLRELFDPRDRRYRYPFINCTNCGPRFTIICDVPYDRPLTTMASFKMCPACQREYDDPTDRRFHAQPNACAGCGPQVTLIPSRGLSNGEARRAGDEAIWEAQQLLAAGKVLAIKGLGGYHLACDARNDAAVRRLRQHKRRWDKPFALMAADPATVETVCELNDAERALLQDRRRPIVLIHRRASAMVAPDVAPRQNTLGLMLPYTPLHYLLFAPAQGSRRHAPCPTLLVMTSGNLSDEPIAYDDVDAVERLAPLVDAFLTHDRAIHIPTDDSVTRVVSGVEVPIRRSRGYAPQPLPLHLKFPAPVLAVGGHLKNTFCLGKERYAFLSQHIGDLDNVETLTSFRKGIAHFERLFDIQPAILAHDLHPDYWSTRYAQERRDVRHVAVQHHHAHIASVIVEHGLTTPVIGVAFDGSGYGPDGTLWGGEFLIADLLDFERVAHLRQVALPGGEQAIHQPWRVAAAWLQQLYGASWPGGAQNFHRGLDQQTWKVLRQMIERGLNCPQTSSMGRLFDAVAALLRLRQTVHYEGQAAVELEAIADRSVEDGYDFHLALPLIDPAPLFDTLLTDVDEGAPAPVIAARFHNGVAAMIAAVCEQLRAQRGLNRVALSGGVFQNAFLLARTLALLQEMGFEACTNQRVPANDGGLSLGQAAVAAAMVNGQ